MSNLDCKKPQPCPTPDPTPTPPKPTPVFSVCIADYTLHWDGTHATLERTRFTPDDTYGSITIQDGCVVGYGEGEVPTYTPPYCNPNPAPCNEGGSGGGGTGTTATVSPRAGNQLTSDNYGLYANAYVQGGTGVTVTGQGTQTSPYIISMAGGTGGGTTGGKIVGQGPITVDERNGVYFVSMPRANLTAVKYGPFNVNEYGVITGIDDNVAMLTSDNIGGSDDVQVTKVTDGITIDLAPTQLTAKSYRFGGYDVSISDGGRVTNATQVARTEAGTYKFGAYNVTLDQFGGITAIAQSSEVPQSAGSFTTSDGSKVFYDDTGRIIRVEVGGSTGKGPIMDAYIINTWGKDDGAMAGTSIESMGTPLVVKDGSKPVAGSMQFELPSYITEIDQIKVYQDNNELPHGSVYTVDLNSRTLYFNRPITIDYGDTASYKLIFRG